MYELAFGKIGFPPLECMHRDNTHCQEHTHDGAQHNSMVKSSVIRKLGKYTIHLVFLLDDCFENVPTLFSCQYAGAYRLNDNCEQPPRGAPASGAHKPATYYK